jgi:hypothetical protein
MIKGSRAGTVSYHWVVLSLSQASIRPQTTERMMGPKKEESWRNIPQVPRHVGMLIVASMSVNCSSDTFVHQVENGQCML